MSGIEGMSGPGVPNACPRCRRHSSQQGRVSHADGAEVVTHFCPYCGNEWSRPVENDLDVGDIVRADLPGSYLYGTVVDVDGDRILVREEPPAVENDLWVKRWQVVIS